jgi:protein-serine/threonine kinase
MLPGAFERTSGSPSPINGSPLLIPNPNLPQDHGQPIPSSSKPRGEDYVDFNRRTREFSTDSVSRATSAKLKLESYYKVTMDTARDRKNRLMELEQKLVQIHPEAREREIRKYSKTESQHLRLRRTKITLHDFRTVKIIGKGAFGEVGLLV